jgi:hypothetical protein
MYQKVDWFCLCSIIVSFIAKYLDSTLRKESNPLITIQLKRQLQSKFMDPIILQSNILKQDINSDMFIAKN